MPYGVVMASGGAGAVAGFSGWHDLALALTCIAVIQAIVIPVRGCCTHSWGSILQCRFGLFTIALGLAVLAENLHTPSLVSAEAVLALAWLATLVLVCWRGALACQPAGRAEVVDGAWFLAPAALLGDAAATAMASGSRPEWVWLAVVTCLAGVAGYLLVVIASGFRLYRRGFAGSPLAPWWISAGCGGLAAAALGKVAGVVPNNALHQSLEGLVVATWAIGTILLIAVLIGCARYAVLRPRGPWSQVWTPVFSMAVYAAGTYQFTQWSGVSWMKEFTLATVVATLALWVANSVLAVWRQRAAFSI